ncbi:tyrosine-type recombinase/integrase (plasmid) [Ralstonia sp. 25C]|uniref:tyrosine-type recombinase/integrase n=1 Tax=Ralstonia sp. 25C TaxID=3447363 RepID=UPI003F74C723
MRFVLADDNLVAAGRTYTGFPLLIGDDGASIQPAQDWLWDLLATAGRISSKRTWENYGRAIYDFFAFSMNNSHEWSLAPPSGMPSAIDAWREWSRGTLELDASTINQRIRVVVRFYKWAVERGHIDRLPFDHDALQNTRSPRFRAEADATDSMLASPKVMLREKRRMIRFLTTEQIVECHQSLSNTTHRMMFELMVRTGMRQSECRTFPDAYVFDPSRRKDLLPGQKIRVYLDPRAMEIKNSVPRGVDVPYDLMEKLWAYSLRHRQRRADADDERREIPHLFLTEEGAPYKKDSIAGIFRALSKRVGFRVTAHMLRHSYATYLLWSLRKSETFEGEPLLYVRDRLGHANVSTTADYLHLVNSLEGHLILAHEDEIDQLFLLDSSSEGLE